MSSQSISIGIAGFGGTGVITSGQLLLKLAAKHGYFGLAQRSFGPQIRGGESLSLLRLSTEPVYCADDALDLLVLLDTEHVDRFKFEVPLTEKSTVIIGQESNEAPTFVTSASAKVAHCAIVNPDDKQLEGGENIVAYGLLTICLGFSSEQAQLVLKEHFSNKPDLLAKAEAWFEAGLELADDQLLRGQFALDESLTSPIPSWIANGNDAAAFGAVKAGVRFVAAYPITPASGMLEWLAPNLEKLDGRLIQAEDELASINMVIGASFGGVPSITATSGPGLALMAESIGLAVASETPLVVFNVMRGGPSTGIPTKSEQSDLNIALHGLHGDAPHLVTAALSIADSAFTAGWSVWLAEKLQVPVIALSDQVMAQSDASMPTPPFWPKKAVRLEAAPSDDPYERYALTDSGISPMAIPGEENMMYTADGLEHNQAGTPSASATDHQLQLKKRAHKLLDFDYEKYWAEIKGEGKTALICWGSVSAVANEAADRLIKHGMDCKVVALRLLAPLQTDSLEAELEGVERVLVVEQSYGKQFLSWLRSHIDFTMPVHSVAKAGPLPIRPSDITQAAINWDTEAEEHGYAANC